MIKMESGESLPVMNEISAGLEPKMILIICMRGIIQFIWSGF